MILKKIIPFMFVFMFAVGTIGIGTPTQSSSIQPLPGVKSLSNAAETAPAYSKATTGAIIGGVAGAISGQEAKSGKTQHTITNAAIGAVLGGAIGHNT